MTWALAVLTSWSEPLSYPPRLGPSEAAPAPSPLRHHPPNASLPLPPALLVVLTTSLQPTFCSFSLFIICVPISTKRVKAGIWSLLSSAASSVPRENSALRTETPDKHLLNEGIQNTGC